MSTIDDLLSAGAKSVKFETPGDNVTGRITDVQVRQATEFGTGAPLTWDDGNPREQIVVTLQTALRDDPDDDGIRSAYIKGWGQQLKAFRAASTAAGKPEKGDTFTATFTGFGPKSPKGGFPPKEFAYQIVKADRLGAIVGDSAPAPAPETSGDTPAAKAQALIALGMDDAQIQQVTGLDLAVIKAIRGA